MDKSDNSPEDTDMNNSAPELNWKEALKAYIMQENREKNLKHSSEEEPEWLVDLTGNEMTDKACLLLKEAVLAQDRERFAEILIHFFSQTHEFKHEKDFLTYVDWDMSFHHDVPQIDSYLKKMICYLIQDTDLSGFMVCEYLLGTQRLNGQDLLAYSIGYDNPEFINTLLDKGFEVHEEDFERYFKMQDSIKNFSGQQAPSIQANDNPMFMDFLDYQMRYHFQKKLDSSLNEKTQSGKQLKL